MFARLSDFVLSHRLVIALALLGVVAVGIVGALKLQSDFSALAFYGSRDPEVDRLIAYKERWGKDDAMLMGVVTAADDTPADLLSPARLRALDELVELLDRDPGVAWVQGLTNTPLLAGGEAGVLDVAPLIERMPDDDFGAFRQRVLADPMLVPQLVSEEGDALGLFIELDTDPDDITELRPAVLSLRTKLDQWELENGAGLQVATAGVPAVRADFFQLILADQLVNVPLLALALTVLLFLIFRRPHGVVAPGVAAAVPAGMVLGVMGWLGEPIGILNQSYFTLLPVIAVADAVHMVSRFHEEIRRRVPPGEKPGPELRREAIRITMSAIGRACLLTSLTTAVGFGSLMAARMPILRTFGLFAALGILFAYVTVLLVIPLLLSLSTGSVPEAGRDGALTTVDRVLLWCADISIHRPVLVLGCFLLLSLAAAFFGTRVRVDNTLTALIGPEHPTRIAGTIADDRLGGILGAEIEFSGPPGSMDHPEVLRAMRRIESWSLQQPEARAVVSPARWLATISGSLTGKAEIPRTRAGVAQMKLLAEGDARAGRMWTGDASRARVTIRTRDDGGNAFAQFAERLDEQMRRDLAGLEVPIEAHITGTPHVAYRGINAVTSDLRDSLVLALFAVTVIIAILFRSPRLALLALVPNGMPLLIGYGLMGLMDWELDPTPAVVFTVALGIAVDDTIHLLVRVLDEQRAGRTLAEGVREAVLHSGRAVTITTVLLCVGFGLNGLSSFPSMQVLGVLGAVVIFVALLGDLFLLPSLLVLADRLRSPR
ncbi:MAG: MMPL family transporter [Deltaproteobacteria bacterium]|nr:MMPL family transporter [Deltaproteobacteria bacterium]